MLSDHNTNHQLWLSYVLETSRMPNYLCDLGLTDHCYDLIFDSQEFYEDINPSFEIGKFLMDRHKSMMRQYEFFTPKKLEKSMNLMKILSLGWLSENHQEYIKNIKHYVFNSLIHLSDKSILMRKTAIKSLLFAYHFGNFDDEFCRDLIIRLLFKRTSISEQHFIFRLVLHILEKGYNLNTNKILEQVIKYRKFTSKRISENISKILIQLYKVQKVTTTPLFEVMNSESSNDVNFICRLYNISKKFSSETQDIIQTSYNLSFKNVLANRGYNIFKFRNIIISVEEYSTAVRSYSQYLVLIDNIIKNSNDKMMRKYLFRQLTRSVSFDEFVSCLVFLIPWEVYEIITILIEETGKEYIRELINGNYFNYFTTVFRTESKQDIKNILRFSVFLVNHCQEKKYFEEKFSKYFDIFGLKLLLSSLIRNKTFSSNENDDMSSLVMCKFYKNLLIL